MSQLIHILRHQASDGLRRALVAAIESDVVNCEQLVQHGASAYDASTIIRQLQAVSEIDNDTWQVDARAAYQSALQETAAAQQNVASKAAVTPQAREKARQFGITHLADQELLALLLRTGTSNEPVLAMAQRILQDHDGFIGLADLDIEELLQAEGLGPAKATEIAASFEIARRLAKAKRGDRVVLRQPEDVADLLATVMSPLRHEELWCLPLDTHARLIGDARPVSRGDIDGTDAGPRAFFRRALQCSAASAIAVHNHPSGDPQPSAADLAVTERFIEAGALIDVPLQDHIIIGDGARYHSIRRSHPHLFQN